MSTESNLGQPSIQDPAEIRKNVAEHVKRIRTGLAFSDDPGQSVVVQDQSEQLKALLSQAGFIISELLAKVPDVKWIEQSLTTRSGRAHSGIYSVNGVCISLWVRCPEAAKEKVESWILRNDVNLCGNVSVHKEEQGLKILLKTLE